MFPAMTGLSPEQRLLKCFSVPQLHNVFVLGCLERRVTVHSQQIRAFNLIHSLYETTIKKDQTPHFVVVGAGIAGLTAAYAALKKRAKVTILEQHAQPLALLRGCLTRWIHPNIYDWPEVISIRPATDLPAFNWKADYAGEVVKVLMKDWDDLVRQPYGTKLKEYFSVSTVQVDEKQKTISFTVISESNLQRTEQIRYDYLILAVGFGIEKPVKGLPLLSYWRNDDLAQIPPQFTPHHPTEVLVSGVGDGGLTDVMRLRLKDFEHQAFLIDFINDENLSELGSKLSLLERQIRSMETQLASAFIHENYRELTIPESAIKAIKDRLRTDTKVTLNGPLTSIFQKDSSVLNRLIVFILLKYGGVRYYAGKIKNIKSMPTLRQKVNFENRDSGEYDRVIIRHGTNPSIAVFSNIYASCSDLKSMAELDATRVPLWKGDSFDNIPAISGADEADGDCSPFSAWIKLLETQIANSLLVRLRSLVPESTLETKFPETPLADIPFKIDIEKRLSPWDCPNWTFTMIENIGKFTEAQEVVQTLNVAECYLLIALPFIIQEIRKEGLRQNLNIERSTDVDDFLRDFPQLGQRWKNLKSVKGDSAKALATIFQSWIQFRLASRFRVSATSEKIADIVSTSLGHTPSSWSDLGWESVSLLSRVVFASERDIDRLGEIQHFTILGRAYRVRLRLVAALLFLAENSLIVPGNLSTALLSHIDTLGTEAFDGARKQISAASIRYDSSNNCMIVEARCSDPYVDHSLTEYAEEFNRKLRSLGVTIANAVSSDFRMPQLVYAAVSPRIENGKGVYVKPLISFSMDPTAIRKLLMGTQLWKVSDLAIRELYQNALDACRYRRCRSEFEGVPYTPKLVFHQGTDSSGREYIECFDNGIGMDVDVLQHNFAKAGRRFIDAPEYLRERDAWQTRGIHLYPVSKFGIGVFSYYLIAREVEIETCRLSKNARGIEQRLFVHIPTSDSLFRVSTAGEPISYHDSEMEELSASWRQDAGTRVRLYLRHPMKSLIPGYHSEEFDDNPYIVNMLKKFVHYPEAEIVIFSQDQGLQIWPPASLNLPASLYVAISSNCWLIFEPVETTERFEESTVRSFRGKAIPKSYDKYKNFEFCRQGWLLVDGIATVHRLPGVTVNLTDVHAPALAVDRLGVENPERYELLSTIAASVSNGVNAWVYRNIPVSSKWLTELWLGFPRELTQLWEQLERTDQPWCYPAPATFYDDWVGSARARTYFPLDEKILREICLSESLETINAAQILQLCRAVYWDRLKPVREKRQSESWSHYDGEWIEKLNLNFIDSRILERWRDYHAGPIEAALLHYLEYEHDFRRASSAVLYASWLTGKTIGVCAKAAIHLGDLLELGSSESWNGWVGNDNVIEDYDAWLLSHCGGTPKPRWIEGKFSIHDLLVITRNSGESLNNSASALMRLSSKISWPVERFAEWDLNALQEFVDEQLLRVLPYGGDIADNAYDFLFTCSWMKSFKIFGQSRSFYEKALRYLKILGYVPPNWNMTQIHMLGELSQDDRVLIENAATKGFPLRLSNGCLFDLAIACYMLDQPIQNSINRARELRAKLELSPFSFPEDPEAAISKLTQDDYKLLSQNLDGKPPWRNGQFCATDLLRCWLNFDNLSNLVKQYQRISEVLGWQLPEWNISKWPSHDHHEANVQIFSRGSFGFRSGHMDIARPTIGKLILLSAERERPLWKLHDHMSRLQQFTGIAPPDLDDTYLGVSWGSLVEESRKPKA